MKVGANGRLPDGSLAGSPLLLFIKLECTVH